MQFVENCVWIKNNVIYAKHTFVACNGWITKVARDAFTYTPVVFGQAKSIQSTAHKWTCRNTITLWTFLVKLAIKVRFTLRLSIHYKKEMTFSMHIGKITIKNILPLSHVPPYPAKVPSGQIHATLLIADGVSVTTHCWELEHGLLTRQGFWQVSLMQVNLGGQSLSTLHSGSSASIAKKASTCI